MSWLKWLGLGPDDVDTATPPSDTIQRIAAELDHLPQERARFVASFAYVLGRAAFADRDISDDETLMMQHLVSELGHLSDSQAALVVSIAKESNELFGGTEGFVNTRTFAEMATREQKEHLLHCLFAVAAADDSVSAEEERHIRQIASELRLSDQDYVAARRTYNDKREVVRRMRAL